MRSRVTVPSAPIGKRQRRAPVTGDLTYTREREMAAQHDMAERGRRLRDFKAATEGKVWHHFPHQGQWLLIPNLDGETAEPVATPDTASLTFTDL